MGIKRNKGENLRKLNAYLRNPENVWLTRTRLSTQVLGYKQAHTIYKWFTSEELTDIEGEALEERKRRSAGKRAVVYDAMFLKAKDGDVSAMKEYLDRMEGKVVNKNETNIAGISSLILVGGKE